MSFDGQAVGLISLVGHIAKDGWRSVKLPVTLTHDISVTVDTATSPSTICGLDC